MDKLLNINRENKLINYLKNNIINRKFILKILALSIWRFYDYQIKKNFKRYLDNKLLWVSRTNFIISFSFFFIKNKKNKFYILIPVNILPIFTVLWNIIFINNYEITNINYSELFNNYIFQALYIIIDAYISYKI